MKSKVNDLKNRRTIHNLSSNYPFNLSENKEIELCFYMIRYLIKCNNHELDDNLFFLLSIPAVRAIAHCQLRVGEPNELIRLAQTVGNQVAIDCLLEIPEVSALVNENSYSLYKL